MELTPQDAPPPVVGARERIVAAAYELFSTRGVRAVGVDAIVERSGVARQTLYRHFDSKQDLVLAFLQRREEQWTVGWLQAEVDRRAEQPVDRLLAVFDVFDEWFSDVEFEGCSFINVMLEHPGADDPIRVDSVARLTGIRSFIEGLARAAGAADPEALARSWHILMKGSIIAACEGDRQAARRSRAMAQTVLEHQQLLPSGGD